jgi:hypothetical protein
MNPRNRVDKARGESELEGMDQKFQQETVRIKSKNNCKATNQNFA